MGHSGEPSRLHQASQGHKDPEMRAGQGRAGALRLGGPGAREGEIGAGSHTTKVEGGTRGNGLKQGSATVNVPSGKKALDLGSGWGLR